jgi:DNA adenine methylase
MQEPVHAPKPLLKWVGGKTKVLDALMPHFPREISGSYRELFVGGGSVLLALLAARRAGTIHIAGDVRAYDANPALIALYTNVQADPDAVVAATAAIIAEFAACPAAGPVDRAPADAAAAATSRESYYYWTRRAYNEMDMEEQTTALGSARFLFLNKTCFRGVFRMGPRGFNVPYGHYANPEIIDVENVAAVSDLIRDVRFETRDFTEAGADIAPGDFVYMDPPYAPETATSFVAYTRGGFGPEQHTALFNMTHSFTEKGIQWCMSNADVALVRDQYRDAVKYTIEGIVCRRAINSKRPDATAREVIVVG